MLHRLRQILEMIRFSHTLFALPFALLSAALAWRSKGRFSWLELIGILLCMVFARSTAMAFNRLADRRLDADNPRTANRHLPSGQLTPAVVWMFTLSCAWGFIASTALFLLAEPPNGWPLLLSLPVLLFICGYSYAKRFTSLVHFWLGASLLLAPVAAWIAIRGLEDLTPPIVLGLAVCFWVAGFDIIYACQDIEFDRQARLSSIPAKLGVPAVVAPRVCMSYDHARPSRRPLHRCFSLPWRTSTSSASPPWQHCSIYEHWLVKPNRPDSRQSGLLPGERDN